MYWIIIANTHHYKIYQSQLGGKDLHLLKEREDPDGRKKDRDLVSDHNGRFQFSTHAHGTFHPRSDPKEEERERFLKNLAKECEQGRVENQFEKLILIAPDKVSGHLKTYLNKHLEEMLNNRIKKDCTRLKEEELKSFLNHHWLDVH